MRLSTSILQRCCCAIPTAKPFVYRLSAYTVSFCRRCFAMLQRIIQIPLTILCFRATLSLQNLFLHVYCGLAISILSCWFKFCYFWCYLCIVPKHSDHVLAKKCDSSREKCVRFPARENCDTNVSAFHNFRNNCVYTLAKRRRSGIIFLKKEHPQNIECGVAAPEGGNTGNAI